MVGRRRVLGHTETDEACRGRGLSKILVQSTPYDRKALVPHRNGPLTETGRLRLARCIVEEGWTLRRAAERFQVSPAGEGDGTTP